MEILSIVLVVVILLIIGISVLIFSNQKKQIEDLKVVSKNIATMNILQNMLEIMSSRLPSEEKLKALNSVIITNYGVKYSTISIFDGYEYKATASNVEDVYKHRIKEVAYDNDFKSNISKNISKYLTTSHGKNLSYKSAIERRIKSAMFSPIYCNGVYLGFWLLEDNVENAFDNISKLELSKLKSNIGVFIDIIQFQKAIENAQNTDKQTGLYNNIYLYSGGRKLIKNNTDNTLCMICLKNIPDINEKYGRNVGNTLIIKIATCIKNSLKKNCAIIRYSGIRFLVLIPNMSAQAIQSQIEMLLSKIKLESEYSGDDKVVVDTQILLHTVKNQNDLDLEIEKMVDYIEGMTSINTIKII